MACQFLALWMLGSLLAALFKLLICLVKISSCWYKNDACSPYKRAPILMGEWAR